MPDTPLLLLVARTESIHTARWIAQILDPSWRVLVFPVSTAERTHPALDRRLVLRSFAARVRDVILDRGLNVFADILDKVKNRVELALPARQVARLRRAIRKHRPALIHSMEMQVAGYLTLEATRGLARAAPPWLMTIWGSDLYLFGRLEAHRHRVREVLSRCDYFSCDCARDVPLAHQLGFMGRTLPPAPVTGGFDLVRLAPRRSQPPSSRRQIALKGYQGISGRALVGLCALERCAQILAGYTIVIYLAAPEVVIAAELFSARTGVPTRILPDGSPHDELLSMHGMSRISIGLAISDGACVSMQEAMVMGSFPIQSHTACASEWFEDGVGGLIVPPDDPEVVEQALRRALTDDALVDGAAAVNWGVAHARLEKGLLRQAAIDGYRELLGRPDAG